MVKVIVIGETGSGKSTLINYLTNFFKHGTLNDLKVAIPTKFHPQVTENYRHHEHNLQDRTQSKTDSCNQYMFADNTAQYLFIDTPGLSDTRTTEQDAINIRKIIEAIENLGELTTVIIVVNGTVARMTVNLRNVITQLRGNLPDMVMENVIVVLTNTNRHAANFSLTTLELNGNVYPYYMQNSAFSTDLSKCSQSALISLQYEWNHAMDELKAMIETLNTFKIKSVSVFKNMKRIRNEIEELLHKAITDMSEIQKIQDDITQLELQLKKVNANIAIYKDYTRDRIVNTIEIVDAPYYSMLCRNCNYVCHDNCGLTISTISGSQILEQCWAMNNGRCTQCQHKCSYTAHYHVKKTDKIIKTITQDVLPDIKYKFDSAQKEYADLQKKISHNKNIKKRLEEVSMQKNENIKTKCHELRRICSSFNFASELHVKIDRLEIESSMLRNINEKQQADVFIRNLKAFCSTIEIDENYERAKNYGLKSMMNIINTERSTTKTILSRTSNMRTSNSNTNANNDVLNRLRILSNQRAEQKTTINVESNEKNTPTSQDKIEPIAEKISDTFPLPTASLTDAEQLAALTNNQLVNYYQTTQDQRVIKSILDELTQRLCGKSMNPLTSPNDIIELRTIVQKYNSLDLSSLQDTYVQLKDRICTIIGSDILKIDQVPSSWLMEIAVVYKSFNRFQQNSETQSIISQWNNLHDSHPGIYQN